MSATSQLALAGGRTLGLESLPGYRAAVAGFLLLALLLFGGASSSDEYAQVPVRLAAVACIAASFWPLEFTVLRPDRWLIAFALACLALPALQLVPLPVARWAALPGHRLYAEVAAAAGSSAWRPLSLTPDLTINALQALLPPFAMLLAALYLDPRDRKAIAALLVTAGIVSAVLALAQLASPGDTLRLYRHTTEGAPVGLFANRNHEAALLACTLPFGAATIVRRPKRLGAPLMLGALGACALLTSVVIVLTGSRMGLALWVIAIVGTLWILHGRSLLRLSEGRGHRRIAILAILFLTFAAVALISQGEAVHRLRGADFAADTRAAALPSLMATARAFSPSVRVLGHSLASIRPLSPTACCRPSISTRRTTSRCSSPSRAAFRPCCYSRYFSAGGCGQRWLS